MSPGLRPARSSATLRRGRGTHADQPRVDADARRREHAGQRLHAERVGLLTGHEHRGSRTVADSRCASGGHRAVLAERRRELRQGFQAAVAARMLVLDECDLALSGLDGQRHDLVPEQAPVDGLDREQVRPQRVLVLLAARDRVDLRDVVRGHAHVEPAIAVGGSRPRRLLELVDDLAVSAARSPAVTMEQERHAAHALGPGGDHDVRVALRDLTHGAVERFERRAARCVHRGAGDGEREAGLQRTEAPDVERLRGLVDLADDHVVDDLRGNARARHHLLQWRPHELVGRHVAQRPAKRALRRPATRHDHDFTFHLLPHLGSMP